MCKLSKREKEVLELCLTCADAKVVGGNCNPPIRPEQVSVHKTRARRKIAKAKAFLRRMKKYKSALFPEPSYKNV